MGSLGVYPTTSAIIWGMSPSIWGASLWEALVVVSQNKVMSHSPVHDNTNDQIGLGLFGHVAQEAPTSFGLPLVSLQPG